MRTSTEWKSPGEVDLYTRLPIAVYGTLREGERNFDRFLNDHRAVVSVVPADVRGYELHELREYASGLPVVIPKARESVAVDVVTIDDSPEGDALRDRLDQLESFQPYAPEPTGLYTRVLAQAVVYGGRSFDCWLYAAGDAVHPAPLGEHSRVAGGDWCQR